MHSLTESLLSTEQTKKIPTTSFMRMWCLGNSNAKVAAYFLSYSIRKNFLHENAQQEALNQTQLKAATQLLGTMGYLRGAIMKIGQLFANMPQIVGPDLVEIFESLQFEAPPMHYSLIRELFLDELGKEPQEIFSFFDKRAFAAASLGQVHRARLYDGTEVAVKIQYPDIARTIITDFKALGLLLQTMRFKEDYQYLKSHIADAQEVFLREVDYLSEAAYMAKNRQIFSGTEIVVPRCFPELSTAKVLTMEHLPGQHLKSFLAQNPSQSKRNHFGELISRSLVQSFFRFQTIYADLHPGNFIFMDDGKLGFIDFGCFQKFSPERWLFEMESEKAMFSNDRDKILQFLAKVSLHEHAEDLDPARIDLLLRQVNWVIAPIQQEGSFDFADQKYVQEGVGLFKAMLRDNSSSRMDSFYNWTNRALLGHRSLMYRLKCNFDYGSLYRNEMKKALS